MNKNHFFLILLFACLGIAQSLKAQTTQTFEYTGDVQTFVIPNCVSEIIITCYGAQGSDGTGTSVSIGGTGGLGAVVSGVYLVTPGQQLSLFVGGAAVGSSGGYNGGGNGIQNSGAGGGASDVRVGGVSLENRIMVAAGGGGGGNSGQRSSGDISIIPGGNGGAAGENGLDGASSSGGGGGFGAIGSAAGIGGTGCSGFPSKDGGVGVLGQGGNATEGPTCCSIVYPAGGAGGGGYMGGGAGGTAGVGTTECFKNDTGAGGGGAGGTNYTSPSVIDPVISGTNEGYGKIVITYTVNTSPSADVTVNGGTLTASATDAAYQWLDCGNSNAPIEGETNQSFTPSQSGNYAVEVKKGGCTVVSDCQNIIITNDKSVNETSFVVYPNPTNDIVNVSLGSQKAKVTLMGLNGTELKTIEAEGNVKFNLESLANGIYLIKIESGNQSVIHKVTKK